MTELATMDVVVAVAIGILGTIFIASLIGLILVCRHKYCRQMDLISKQLQESRPEANLVENMEGPTEVADLELDDVRMTASLEVVLRDSTWVNDVTGLAPHCLEILRTCHMLTEKLVGMTMGNAQQLRTPETLNEIVSIAKRINPRVDEVVRSMYPPLDPRLLEARCTALVLSVSHLVLVTKSACRLSGVADWIDQSLADVEDHLRVLREASKQYEATLKTPNNNSQQGDHQSPNGVNQQQQQQQPGNHGPGVGNPCIRNESSEV